jgi:hypothetical protein
LCPAETVFHQDGHHSGVALLLKAALIQVTILEEDHPMTILSKFGSRQEDFYVNFP